jgi:glycosyltransferase involved in cell wall biosynthesis
MMKIAVNTRFLIKDRLEGIGVFTNETLRYLVKNHQEHQFYFIFDRQWDDEFIFSDNIIPAKTGPQARHPILWYIWFEFSLKKILKKIQPDIFISPDGYIPLNTKYKTLSVIHDIAFEHYPVDVPYLVRKYYRFFFPRFASQSTRIATVSEYTRHDLCTTYHLDENKIDIVYNGVNQEFRPISEEEKEIIQLKLTSGKKYFVYAGALHARKNVENLLRAYDIYREMGTADLKLVIIGRKAWKIRAIEVAFRKMKFKNDVIFTGRVNDRELKSYIAAAEVMVYVSYFEGFGLPVLEAFNCDVPAIVSNCSSLPEIAGNAALMVNPFNPADIAMSMKMLTENNGLRKELIDHARVIRKKFSWEKTAASLWETVLKTI